MSVHPNARILLVNEDRVQIDGIIRALGLEFQISTRSSAEQALTLLSISEAFDAIIVDFHLRKISGAQLCHLLRSPEYKTYNSTPLILTSSTFSSIHFRNIAADLNANASVTVPEELETLYDTVRTLLKGETVAATESVLIVEDSVALSNLLTKVFTERGYATLAANSGAQARELFRMHGPEIAVLDYYLPDCEGDELLELFRNSHPDTVIIMMTTDSNPELATQFIKKGADGYVRKPFDPEYLITLSKSIQRTRSLSDLERRLDSRTRMLAESDERVRALIAASPLGIVTLDMEGRVTMWNQASEAMFGWSSQEVLGRILPVVPPDQSDEFRGLIGQVFGGEKINGVELKRLTKGGSIIDVSLYTAPLRDSKGAICGVMGVYMDISKRKTDESMLRMTQFSIEKAEIPVFWIDSEARIINVNEKTCSMLGYTRHELLAMTLFDLDPTINPDDWDTRWSERRVSGCTHAETLHRRKDGTDIPVEIFINFMTFAGKEYHFDYVYDLTERKKAEQSLLQSEERYRTLAGNLPDVLIRIDPEFNCLYANGPAIKLVGFDFTAIPVRKIGSFGLLQPPEMSSLENEIKKVFTTAKPSEIQLTIPSNSEGRIFDIRIIPEFDLLGVVSTVIGIGRDITGQKRLEDQLLQVQKMEAIGQLAGGIAHDFNNLLTSILSYSNILALESESGTRVNEAARVIEKAAERAAELTSKLLGFARRGKFLNIPIDVHECIREVTLLLSRTLDKNIHLTQRLTAGRSIISGDPGQIQQTILNLAVNARDAMPDGGSLTFFSKTVRLDKHFCSRYPESIPGDYVQVSVIDTGKGIPHNIRERIFEPFFTTKDQGKGTGMGLAMVYGIVKNHNGIIHVESQEGSGSEFRLYFPLSTDASVLRSSVISSDMPHGAGSILIVDDEVSVGAAISLMLSTLGYSPIAFTDVEKAIDFYRDNRETVRLAIIDLIMPKMGGRECFRALKAVNPHIKAILSSGYGLDGKAQEIISEGMAGFLQKPSRMRDLAVIVRDVLSRDSTASC